MSDTIFLAGASGAIGRRLVPLLFQRGFDVVGTTRSESRALDLKAVGVRPVIIDVFDADALREAVCETKPVAIIHQLTDLSAGLDKDPEPVLRNNARLRDQGTANLISAARAAGVKRVVAQSIAWAYAPGAKPYSEDAPLDTEATGTRGISIREGVVPLENAVLRTDGIEGLVLRYGELYGPGTWTEMPKGTAPVHVDAAALAACLALERGTSGPYNVAEPGHDVLVRKALDDLQWRPDFRLGQDMPHSAA